MRFTYEFAEINQKVPMIAFLDELSIKERARVFASIEKLVELEERRDTAEGEPVEAY